MSVIVYSTGGCVRHEMNNLSLKPTGISFSTLFCDCGSVKQGSEGTCRFSFNNTGKHDLQISRIYSTWDRIQPTWPKELIKPGKGGEVNILFQTDFSGAFSKSIYVQSNAKPVTLVIKGNVQ